MSHIVSHCRKLRDTLNLVALPPPPPNMIQEVPLLIDSIPRRLRHRIVSAEKPVHGSISYLDAAKRPAAQHHQRSAPQEPALQTLIGLVTSLQATIVSLTQTVDALQQKLSDQDLHIQRLESHLHDKLAIIARPNLHLEDDSDDDSHLPLAPIPIAMPLPDLELHLRNPIVPVLPVLPAAASAADMEVDVAPRPKTPPIGAGDKRDVSATKSADGPKVTPDAKRQKHQKKGQ